MGFLKNAITAAVAKKAEDILVDKFGKELPYKNKIQKVITQEQEEKIQKAITQEQENKKKKKRLFQSRTSLAGAASIYFFFTQFLIVIILLVCHGEDLTAGGFFGSCAMAAIITWSLLLVLMLVYALYREDMLMFAYVLLFAMILVFITAPLGAEGGYSVYRYFFLGLWMTPLVKAMFCLLGIATLGTAIALYIYLEDKEGKRKAEKQPQIPAVDEKAEAERNALRTAIQDNAVVVRFLKRRWDFTTNADVLFGYHEENKQLVFVGERNSYVLNNDKIVYLDFEDVERSFNEEINNSQYKRLIKLYYLGSGRKEYVLPLAQCDILEEEITKIKQYANKTFAGNDEVVFRRRIRHVAAGCKSAAYPRRPFDNDEWFDELKETMEKYTNSKNKSDGYSLFREQVIAMENFATDKMLLSIIQDMSMDPPNKGSAQNEARRLCYGEFRAKMVNGIMSSFKDIFPNNKQ